MNIRYSSLLLCSLAGVATAQSPEAANEDPDAIEEIIVTAAPLGRSADELTQAVMVLDDDDLRIRAAASIGETLANEPGISSTYFGPVSGRPVIRGQSGPRISVLEGGVGTLDVADISPDHAVPIEPLFADSVEIIRGPATLLYGSSAAGGVVNVIDGRIPRQPADAPFSAAIELRGDTVAEQRAGALRLDGGTDRFAWHLDAFDRESEDIDIKGFATADPNERSDEEQSGTVINSAGASSGYAAGGTAFLGNGSIGLSVSRYENTYGLPKAEEEEEGEEEGPLIAPGPFIDLEQTRTDLLAEFMLDGAFESIKLRAGYNDYEHSEIEPNGEIGTRFENEAWEARVELVHAPISGWRGAIGLQLNDRDFSAAGEEAYIPPTTTNSAGLFLLEEHDFGFGIAEIGVRIEQLEHEPTGTLPGYDETAFSIATGVNIDLGEDRDLRVNLSRSERHPDAAELYSDGGHLATGLFEVGLLASGQSVTQETSNNLDMALHQHSAVGDWEISLFYNQIDDYIFLNETGAVSDGLPVALYVQDDARFFGIEAEWSRQLGASPWHTRVFADYVRGKTDSDDLPRIQPPRLGLSLAYDSAAWSAEAQAIYHASQDQISSFNTDSFTMLNVSALRRIESGNDARWELFGKLTNLLDEDARRSTSFLAAFVPLPGVSLEAGMRLRFR